MLDLIEKYKKDNNELRLVVLLETYNKKNTKPNIAALKMLILDDDLDAVAAFLGTTNPKSEQLEQIPHNQDDFKKATTSIFGDPKDANSVGNRILDGRLISFSVATYIPPDKLLSKFAAMAGREAVEIDSYPDHTAGGTPVWQCGIKGMVAIKRDKHTKVNS